MVAKSFKNENILKLRELSNLMCSGSFDNKQEKKYKDVVEEIKEVLKSETEYLSSEKSRYKKMKCYENIYKKLEHVLNKIKNF